MLEFGFNSNLVELSKQNNLVKTSKNSIDKNSFFGSYLTICEEENEKFDKNPFRFLPNYIHSLSHIDCHLLIFLL